MYLAIVVDRATGKPVFMASTQGGMEIEEVAAKDPETILRETIDPVVGFRPYQARKLAFGLGLPAESVAKAVPFLTALYRAFEATDASLARDQPVPGHEGRATCSRSTRRSTSTTTRSSATPTSCELRDFDEEEPLEIEAAKYDLNYIKLEAATSAAW